MESFHAVMARVAYRFRARHRGGFGVHSPYLFHFLNFVLFEQYPYYIYDRMDALCRRLSRSRETVDGMRVSRLVPSGTTPRRLNELLHRICVHISARTVVEVGGGVGLSAAYMAAADSRSTVWSILPDTALAAYAAKLQRGLKLGNIIVRSGSPRQLLPQLLAEAGRVDLFHILLDASMSDSEMEALFSTCRGAVHHGTVMVIDGIHASPRTERLWRRATADPAVSLSVDIYWRGILWFNPELPRRCFTVAY